MCTATWLCLEGGYELFFNRDVALTRVEAEPPAIRSIDGVDCIAPLDPETGGTWIGVNHYGLSLAVTNYYYPAGKTPATGTGSRGTLLASLLGCATKSEVVERLGRTMLTPYHPFILLIVESGATAAVFWEQKGGEAAVLEKVAAPVTSSSFRTGEVITHRTGLFRQMLREKPVPDAETLLKFHRGHLPEAGPYSVCMHRGDARTASFSRIQVGREAITFSYAPGPPCGTACIEPVTLKRVRRV